MEIVRIIEKLGLSPALNIEQIKREEDGSYYSVWRISDGGAEYILKEAKEYELEVYKKLLRPESRYTPRLFKTVADGDRSYLLLEYVTGEDLRTASRSKLKLALDALNGIQEGSWENRDLDSFGYTFEKSLESRISRGKYLNDPMLEKAYARFLKVYKEAPRALCHDDLLPFNVIVSDDRAVIIDWEYAGMLPYLTSFARLIAHGREENGSFFYLSREDRAFAVDYYYEKLIKAKGISREKYLNDLEYFLFYENCEWVYCGNKYGDTDSERYKEYLELARSQADKL